MIKMSTNMCSIIQNSPKCLFLSFKITKFLSIDVAYLRYLLLLTAVMSPSACKY